MDRSPAFADVPEQTLSTRHRVGERGGMDERQAEGAGRERRGVDGERCARAEYADERSGDGEPTDRGAIGGKPQQCSRLAVASVGCELVDEAVGGGREHRRAQARQRLQARDQREVGIVQDQEARDQRLEQGARGVRAEQDAAA
jgi:hypothetical protein